MSATVPFGIKFLIKLSISTICVLVLCTSLSILPVLGIKNNPGLSSLYVARMTECLVACIIRNVCLVWLGESVGCTMLYDAPEFFIVVETTVNKKRWPCLGASAAHGHAAYQMISYFRYFECGRARRALWAGC